MPPSMTRGALSAQPLTLVKLKCGLTEDGRFVCERTKKHDRDDDSHSDEHSQSGSKKSTNKCKGPNDCPDGYRDLEKPSKYGACCELIKDEAGNDAKPNEDVPKKDETEPPKSGGCHQVTNMQEMSCGGAVSCSAIENGKMTCCCVK